MAFNQLFTNSKQPWCTHFRQNDMIVIIWFIWFCSRLIIKSSGIFGCYFYYGVVQEKITRGTYGEKQERYYYTMFLVFCQCIINSFFAKSRYQLSGIVFLIIIFCLRKTVKVNYLLYVLSGGLTHGCSGCLGVVDT